MSAEKEPSTVIKNLTENFNGLSLAIGVCTALLFIDGCKTRSTLSEGNAITENQTNAILKLDSTLNNHFNIQIEALNNHFDAQIEALENDTVYLPAALTKQDSADISKAFFEQKMFAPEPGPTPAE